MTAPKCQRLDASEPTTTKREQGIRLQPEPGKTSMAGGGTVVYRVTVDGRWIGWVGDERPWRGWRYGGRKWWACWRENGDDAARWNSFAGQPHATRAAALADLLDQVANASR